MAAFSIELPAGGSSAVTKQITLPTSGGWCGLTRVRISTFGQDATLHEWLFIYPNAGNITRFRRTNISSANNWYNGILKRDTEQLRWLGQNESIMRLTYTSTNPISLVCETTRSIKPFPPPALPMQEWNKKNTSPVSNLWTPAATGNNLAANNPTERAVAGSPGQMNGVIYWTNLT